MPARRDPGHDEYPRAKALCQWPVAPWRHGRLYDRRGRRIGHAAAVFQRGRSGGDYAAAGIVSSADG